MDEISILASIKVMLGIDKEDTTFDMDITIHINSVFMALNQLGVGPPEVFAITDKDDTWDDFIDEDEIIQFNSLKSYMFMKVKLVFDPPLSSAVIASYEKLISEFEWRLYAAAGQNKEV
jgi:hypothetical protein